MYRILNEHIVRKTTKGRRRKHTDILKDNFVLTALTSDEVIAVILVNVLGTIFTR